MIHVASGAVLMCCGWGTLMTACSLGETSHSDRSYVVAFCSAAAEFQQDSLVLKPDGEWTPEGVRQLGEAYDDWADALDAVEPPPDLLEFHASLVAEMREAADELARGTAPDRAVYPLGLLSFPDEAAVRLSAVSAGVDECDVAHFHFDTPIGVI